MDISRRRIVTGAVAGVAAGVLVPALRAAELVATPRQAEGPFYPVNLPLDKDNDLASVAGRTGTAQGEITNVVGRVLDERGEPVAGAQIEIWQCNAFGRYHHPGDNQSAPLDPNFQGYGQFTTGADGAYRFRTIKPVAYPGRAPHIHFKLGGKNFRGLTTQMYVAGAAENEADFLLRSVRDTKLRKALLVELQPGQGGELLGNFDIVLPNVKRLSALFA